MRASFAAAPKTPRESAARRWASRWPAVVVGAVGSDEVEPDQLVISCWRARAASMGVGDRF